MKLSRRDFLKLSAQAGLATPFLLGTTGCALLAQDRFDRETGLSLCCVTGEVTPDGAVVWVRAEPESAVAVEYATDAALSAPAATGAIKVAADADYAACIT